MSNQSDVIKMNPMQPRLISLPINYYDCANSYADWLVIVIVKKSNQTWPGY